LEKPDKITIAVVTTGAVLGTTTGAIANYYVGGFLPLPKKIKKVKASIFAIGGLTIGTIGAYATKDLTRPMMIMTVKAAKGIFGMLNTTSKIAKGDFVGATGDIIGGILQPVTQAVEDFEAITEIPKLLSVMKQYKDRYVCYKIAWDHFHRKTQLTSQQIIDSARMEFEKLHGKQTGQIINDFCYRIDEELRTAGKLSFPRSFL
jgi:hypothetical protein